MDLIDLWSGATPYRTSPYGVGSRSSTSTRTGHGGSSAAPCLMRASAVYRPAGPEPTTATLRVFTDTDSAPTGAVVAPWTGRARRAQPDTQNSLPSGSAILT